MATPSNGTKIVVANADFPKDRSGSWIGQMLPTGLKNLIPDVKGVANSFFERLDNLQRTAGEFRPHVKFGPVPDLCKDVAIIAAAGTVDYVLPNTIWAKTARRLAWARVIDRVSTRFGDTSIGQEVSQKLRFNPTSGVFAAMGKYASRAMPSLFQANPRLQGYAVDMQYGAIGVILRSLGKGALAAHDAHLAKIRARGAVLGRFAADEIDLLAVPTESSTIPSANRYTYEKFLEAVKKLDMTKLTKDELCTVMDIAIKRNRETDPIRITELDALNAIAIEKLVAETASRGQTQSSRLFGDVVSKIDAQGNLYLAQCRGDGATIADEQNFASVKPNGKNFSFALTVDGDGTEHHYYRLNIQAFIKEVAEKENAAELTFDRELAPVKEEIPEDENRGLEDTVLFYRTPTNDENQNLNHHLTAEAFRKMGLHVMTILEKRLLSGTLFMNESNFLAIENNLAFLDMLRNHFVNKLENTTAFSKADARYKFHAEQFHLNVRGEIINALAARRAEIAKNQCIEIKKPLISGGHPTSTLDAINEAYLPHLKSFVNKTRFELNIINSRHLGNGEVDLAKSTFINSYNSFMKTVRSLHEAGSIEECVRENQEGHSLLKTFYEEIHFMRRCLKNNFVGAKIAPFLKTKELNSIVQKMDDTMAGMTRLFNSYFYQANASAHDQAALTLQAHEKAKDFGRMQSRGNFYLNAFEKAPEPITHTIAKGVARFAKLFSSKPKKRVSTTD